MTDPILDVSWVGEAIAIVRNPAFKDDLGLVGEAITAFVAKRDDDSMILIVVALSELAEEIGFFEAQR